MMKKLLSLILAFILCLSLCACGKSDALIACEGQIEALGDITLDSKRAIEYARSAYDGLSEKDQTKVSNYEKLTAAEAAYEILEAELLSQVETLKADPGAKSLNALRQMPVHETVQEAIAATAMEIFAQQIRENGYRDQDDPDTHIWQTKSFTFEVDDEYLTASVSNSSPRVPAENSFRLSSSETQLRFYAAGCLFSRCDMFVYDRTEVTWVSLNTSLSQVTQKEDVAQLGMEVSTGMGMQKWPYSVSKDTLAERFSNNTDADEFLLELDSVLRKLKMPFSAWELAGIYDPDAGGQTTEEPEMASYPGTQILTFDAYVDCDPQVEEEKSWVIYSYVHDYGEADTTTYLSYTHFEGEFYLAFKTYEEEVLSQMEKKTYYSNPESKTGDTCYVWFDGNGYALARRAFLKSASYTVAIHIIEEADVEAYVEHYFNS